MQTTRRVGKPFCVGFVIIVGIAGFVIIVGIVLVAGFVIIVGIVIIAGFLTIVAFAISAGFVIIVGFGCGPAQVTMKRVIRVGAKAQHLWHTGKDYV